MIPPSQEIDQFSCTVWPSASAPDGFAQNVRQGLKANQKRISPQYFYDKEGSRLFDAICGMPEYYLARVEESILIQHIDNIVSILKESTALVELGSGTSVKTKILIEAMIKKQGPLHYLPIDISEAAIREGSKSLLKKFPALNISAHVADYLEGMNHIEATNEEPKLVVFLGSSLGNFHSEEAVKFLNNIRHHIGPKDHFLIGLDMQKEKSVLEAAYNDQKGITADFNLNVLDRINRELGGQFLKDNFSHLAFYNPHENRIEMHLKSNKDHNVYIQTLGMSIPFRKDETIHTECSYKYNPTQLEDISRQAGFNIVHRWQDEKEFFNLVLFGLDPYFKA